MMVLFKIKKREKETEYNKFKRIANIGYLRREMRKNFHFKYTSATSELIF